MFNGKIVASIATNNLEGHYSLPDWIEFSFTDGTFVMIEGFAYHDDAYIKIEPGVASENGLAHMHSANDY